MITKLLDSTLYQSILILYPLYFQDRLIRPSLSVQQKLQISRSTKKMFELEMDKNRELVNLYINNSPTFFQHFFRLFVISW